MPLLPYQSQIIVTMSTEPFTFCGDLSYFDSVFISTSSKGELLLAPTQGLLFTAQKSPRHRVEQPHTKLDAELWECHIAVIELTEAIALNKLPWNSIRAVSLRLKIEHVIPQQGHSKVTKAGNTPDTLAIHGNDQPLLQFGFRVSHEIVRNRIKQFKKLRFRETGSLTAPASFSASERSSWSGSWSRFAWFHALLVLRRKSLPKHHLLWDYLTVYKTIQWGHMSPASQQEILCWRD